ncbi:membrane protein [Mycolicibacterium arabiense]|uniref:Membrane protein n=1 Tax=Mycolicibacterium arabiense TaxID=1286181 RepID=A0A7I7S233_9MYCO|nr:hemolysin family protein [Mycolicibacterium arabiense]MCV7371324.1 HlyC/CorC family transporter [Mycolicibacterium arabiense]BBY50025.1 membrane protein [Mycolicibacterium arabiense]
MNDPLTLIAITTALIAASAFFVAVEFALIAARRHRLEDAAPSSRSARAALQSTTELSVLLAGSQLGITVCTLALGAVTKPAVHCWLTPIIGSWGAPNWAADVGGFVVALVIVTFLHLVVGEMAPKSWAIAHPERSAIMLALPMRAYMTVTRPLLVVLNRAANWCLRKIGVTPVDEVASAQDPDALRHLVEHSTLTGTLDERYGGGLISALELQRLTIGDVVSDEEPHGVAPTAGPTDIQSVSRATGHLRLLVVDDQSGVLGVVHVRDSVTAAPDSTAADLMRPALALPMHIPVYEALRTMRDTRGHLAAVRDDTTGTTGVVTLTDVLDRLMPASSTTT